MAGHYPSQLTIFIFHSIVTYFSEINKLQFLVQYFLCINHNIVTILLCVIHNISFKTLTSFSIIEYRFINMPIVPKYFSESCLCIFSHTSSYCDRAYIVFLYIWSLAQPVVFLAVSRKDNKFHPSSLYGLNNNKKIEYAYS